MNHTDMWKILRPMTHELVSLDDEIIHMTGRTQHTNSGCWSPSTTTPIPAYYNNQWSSDFYHPSPCNDLKLLRHCQINPDFFFNPVVCFKISNHLSVTRIYMHCCKNINLALRCYSRRKRREQGSTKVLRYYIFNLKEYANISTTWTIKLLTTYQVVEDVHLYYEITPKKETISCIFINLMGNIQEYNMGKIYIVISKCHNLAKWLSQYLYFFSFSFYLIRKLTNT